MDKWQDLRETIRRMVRMTKNNDLFFIIFHFLCLSISSTISLIFDHKVSIFSSILLFINYLPSIMPFFQAISRQFDFDWKLEVDFRH